jgi:peptidoglycan-associated lipoprotein
MRYQSELGQPPGTDAPTGLLRTLRQRPVPSQLRPVATRCLLIVLALLVAASCHKKPTAAPVTQAPEAAPAPAPPSPPTCNLTGEPASVEQGAGVTLSWESRDATEVDIKPGLGKQLTEGSASVKPVESTTYILTATGPGGTTTCTARVTVTVSTTATPTVKEENIAPASFSEAVRDAFFDYDSSALRSDAQQALTTDAAFLKAHPDIKFVIEGHCDQRGSEEYNLGLGDRRAQAARDFLANLGVAPDRMSAVSYGKTRLVCNENTEACWQKNRRDHLALK